MDSRGAFRVAVCLCALACFSPPADAAPTDDELPFELELPRRERPRRIVRDLLGNNRLRSLRLTRYRMDLYDLDFGRELAADLPAQEEAEGVLLSSFLRVSRERLERQWLLKERYDAFRGRLRGREAGAIAPPRADRLSLRTSPRAYFVDGDALVGAKFRLRGLRSPVWSSAGVGVTHELSGNNLRVRFSIDRVRWATYLTYHSDRGRRGESAELGISLSF